MPASLFDHVLLPVASREDALATARAAVPYVTDAGGRVTVVHVVEKAGGAVDKASVEQREEAAQELFETAEAVFADADVPMDARLAYGTDVADAIFSVADEVAATAVAFTGRDSGVLDRLLTGNVEHALVTENDLPVIALPRIETDE